MFEDVLGHLDEDDVVLDGLFFECLRPDSQYDIACMKQELLFRLYLSMTGVSVVKETWSVPVEKA